VIISTFALIGLAPALYEPEWTSRLLAVVNDERDWSIWGHHSRLSVPPLSKGRRGVECMTGRVDDAKRARPAYPRNYSTDRCPNDWHAACIHSVSRPRCSDWRRGHVEL
jgi:hypothetical protein